MRRRLIQRILVPAAALTLCGCHREPGAEPSRFVVVLVDHTASMVPHREQQMRDLAMVIASLEGGDTLEIYPITENPLSSPRAITMTLPAFEPSRMNTRTYGAYLEREANARGRAAIRAVRSKIFGSPPSADTAILDSLDLAGRVFTSSAARSHDKKELIILSDMWEDQRGGLHLARERLSPARMKALLDTLAASNRLSQLTGVHLWVAGARIHRESPRPVEDGIEAFWQAAFRRMGTEIRRERYAPTLRDFNTSAKRIAELLASTDAALGHSP